MLQPNLPSASARTVRELHPVPAGWPGIRVLIVGGALLALFSVAICGAALWLRLESARGGLRLIASSLIALICFFSHLAAFGLYALIILGIELPPAIAEWRIQHWPALGRRAALFAAQFLVPAA